MNWLRRLWASVTGEGRRSADSQPVSDDERGPERADRPEPTRCRGHHAHKPEPHRPSHAPHIARRRGR